MVHDMLQDILLKMIHDIWYDKLKGMKSKELKDTLYISDPSEPNYDSSFENHSKHTGHIKAENMKNHIKTFFYQFWESIWF